MDTFHQKSWLGYLAIVRIFVGTQFVQAAWPKVFGGHFLSGQGRGLGEQLLAGAAKDPLLWHRAFIIDFVAPNAHFFSYLVAFGELAIGISLITGCLMRVSSSFGALHNANIYLAIAYANGAQANFNRLLIVLHIVFVCASAGRVLGIDGLLAKRFPRSPLF